MLGHKSAIQETDTRKSPWVRLNPSLGKKNLSECAQKKTSEGKETKRPTTTLKEFQASEAEIGEIAQTATLSRVFHLSQIFTGERAAERKPPRMTCQLQFARSHMGRLWSELEEVSMAWWDQIGAFFFLNVMLHYTVLHWRPRKTSEGRGWDECRAQTESWHSLWLRFVFQKAKATPASKQSLSWSGSRLQ